MNFGIVILAAGASSRLGKPKQLLDYQGRKLIQHIVSVAENSNAGSIVIVLGANHELISEVISTSDKINMVINHHWQRGIASSIVKGVQFLQHSNPSCDGVIITVCDQPYISSSLINDLYTLHQQTRKHIIASSYENIVGTPVFFYKSLFPELLTLTGDSGAKKIMIKYKENVATVDFPFGNFDIDTFTDYELLIKKVTNDH